MTPEIVTREDGIIVGVRQVLEPGTRAVGAFWREALLAHCNRPRGADGVFYVVFNILPEASRGLRYEYVAGVAGSLDEIPAGMVGWEVPAGTFAQAESRGVEGVEEVCREIETDWLPDSDYLPSPSPRLAFTADPSPDSPEAVWKVNVPVATPAALERLRQWV